MVFDLLLIRVAFEGSLRTFGGLGWDGGLGCFESDAGCVSVGSFNDLRGDLEEEGDLAIFCTTITDLPLLLGVSSADEMLEEEGTLINSFSGCIVVDLKVFFFTTTRL